MAAKFVVSASNAEISKVIKQIGWFDGKSRLASSKVLRNATRRIKGGAVRRVAVRSGNLKRSIKSSYSDDKLIGIIRAQSPYAHLVEFGAKGKSITARRKKAMKVIVADGYKFIKKARIPSRKAKPFIMPAFEAEAPNIVKDLKQAIQRSI